MTKSKQTVVLFGTDQETKKSGKKIKDMGRDVIMEPRASFDTGIGICGKHLCNCRECIHNIKVRLER